MSVLGITASGSAIPKTAVKAAENEFSFFDTVLDTINPLQHLPIVSSIYRGLTGDTQNAISNIVGGTLFGGPVGGGIAAASEVFKAITGDSNSPEPTQTALAAKTTPQKASQAYKKMGASTAEWLNPKVDNIEVATNIAASHKIKATTKEWLSA